MSEKHIVRCPSCGTNNRVDPEKIAQGTEAVCARCKKPLPSSAKPVIVTDATFGSDVERSSLPVLLDLWAEWCGPCRMIAPALEELAAEMAGRVRIAKLNIDENQATAARFNVRSISDAANLQIRPRSRSPCGRFAQIRNQTKARTSHRIRWPEADGRKLTVVILGTGPDKLRSARLKFKPALPVEETIQAYSL